MTERQKLIAYKQTVQAAKKQIKTNERYQHTGTFRAE